MDVPRGVDTIGKGVFKDCESLVSIHIPDSVTSIGDYAFWQCKALANVEIPASVTSIGMSAFESCDSLQTVCFRHRDIGGCEIDAEAFKRVDLNKCTLCVSEENLGACRLHPVLSKFKHIVTFF